MEKSEVVSEKVCSACGVEVRSGSFYCYNCGGQVSDHAASIDPSSYLHKGPGLPAANGNSERSVPKRRSRNSRKRLNEPVQITWKRDEKPGIGFLLISVAAAMIAFLSLCIAYYLH